MSAPLHLFDSQCSADWKLRVCQTVKTQSWRPPEQLSDWLSTDVIAINTRKTQFLRDLTAVETWEKQTPAGNAEDSRDHSSGRLSVLSVLFALTYTCMMYFSFSITIHLGLEKESELAFLGLEHMETMLQRIITYP